ncbi:MAG TPA: UDP-N-acetylmuramoyl-L-alanine--D-glutamate ligase [Polyangiaceae bacterium]|jgi:UDP-N-acetylmuramoylalanine--D-glutamate ligase|nr:UDP-N-acetylmuramoyl-L-alanine--D-glutamate ligase [Polyangiaceae bacterium]
MTMDLSGQRVIVVGLGKSGAAAARLCRDRGASVLGTDSAPLERLSADVTSLGIELVAGGHDAVRFTQADLVVVSPGVAAFPALELAERAGVEVIGELELACRFITAPVLAIGGTNGKSTTTTLVGELLKAAGSRVFVGGNLGEPAASAAGKEWDQVVLEVSSFQLERAPLFRPRVSVLLNVTEDHLDRYASFELYAEAKGNAFVNQEPGDVAVIPFGDDECEKQARRGRGDRVTFGTAGDYAVDDGSVFEARTGERFELGPAKLFGTHNHSNAAAAIATVRALDVGVTSVTEGLRRFGPLPHRMALVGELSGVRFYDDSKGTNVGASVTALLGLAEPRGVLIAGGRDKHGSYEPLVAALRERGRAVVVMGEAADRIHAAIGGAVPTEHATDMNDAVRRAFRLAERGDAVLLSPACSSFDMFKSYADRGERFVEAFERLRSEGSR